MFRIGAVTPPFVGEDGGMRAVGLLRIGPCVARFEMVIAASLTTASIQPKATTAIAAASANKAAPFAIRANSSSMTLPFVHATCPYDCRLTVGP